MTVEQIAKMEDRVARRAAYVELSRQWMRKLGRMEALMTDAQQKTWRDMVGETWLKEIRK